MTLALVGFAVNSVLCRAALEPEAIDAASFTIVRLASGALVLAVLSLAANRGRWSAAHGSWRAALSLFLYAICFSYAYLSLSAGTGALVLFGMVQATMILAGLVGGERPSAAEWLGWLLAIGGLVYLLFPGIAGAPSPGGSVLMGVSGVAWGAYTLLGRNSTNPLAATTNNFIRCLPFLVVVGLFGGGAMQLSPRGIVLAALSGGVASGIGYACWYRALRGLGSFRGAIVQLPVPALAALGGIMFLSEELTPRLVIASLLILGGIGLALRGRERLASAK